MNQAFLDTHSSDEVVVDIVKIDKNQSFEEDVTEVEMDEMWSYVVPGGKPIKLYFSIGYEK